MEKIENIAILLRPYDYCLDSHFQFYGYGSRGDVRRCTTSDLDARRNQPST